MEIRALLASWGTELLEAVALAALLRLFVVALTRVRGTSMQPTLPDGAWLLVAVWPARLSGAGPSAVRQARGGPARGRGVAHRRRDLRQR